MVIIMTGKKFTKLPESELEVMQAIWILNEEGERNISAGLIMKRFPQIQRLKLTTVLTLITRLIAKEFIVSKKIGRANCYTPLVPYDEYKKFAVEDFIGKMFVGNKVALLEYILDTDLTADELASMKALIEKK